MNCLEEVKQFYASTSKEYLDYIRNCERNGKQKECRFSSLNVSVGTSIFEMLNKQFQL